MTFNLLPVWAPITLPFRIANGQWEGNSLQSLGQIVQPNPAEWAQLTNFFPNNNTRSWAPALSTLIHITYPSARQQITLVFYIRGQG
jgi:hypothetical protein